jgi:hypothetical protein
MSTSGASTSGSSKPIAINIHSVTADGIKASSKGTMKEGKGKGKEKEKMSDLLAEEVVRGIMKKGKEMRPVSREQKEFVSRGGKFDPKAVDPNFVTPEEKEAMWYARTIFRYYQSFPEKLGKMPTVKAIDPSQPGALPKLKEHLAHIQAVMNSNFSAEVTSLGVWGVGTAIEFAWMVFCYKQPWNPMGGMDLSNLGAETMAYYDYLEPELKELQILWADWLEQGVWMRLMSKMTVVVRNVAEKNAKTAREADELANKMRMDPQFADL